MQPKLVELQAFPSLYAYQGPLAQAYIDAYGLDARLKYFLSGLEKDSYRELLRRAIVGGHDPENVILMEIHPQHQKTLPDFLLTEKMLGIRTVDLADIKKEGSRLYYDRGGKRMPMRRICRRRCCAACPSPRNGSMDRVFPSTSCPATTTTSRSTRSSPSRSTVGTSTSRWSI